MADIQQVELVGLDSNTLRDWLLEDAALEARIGLRQPCLPMITLLESLQGWIDLAAEHNKKQREDRYAQALENLRRLLVTVNPLPVLPYDAAAQAACKSLRAGRGNRSRNDLRIAAICISHGVPLLTRNVRDFEDLPGLIVEPC